ncbi:hypothetical protein CDD81_1749 [Ophiocordyceps australis]|uniref:Rhodopsin domain-containing protein n=1 Tax=Ophiocordyceps australis TaxID=1399860 RepID=A0A2C5YDH3_9HYPO|nr:hypothetical protein CDD81_1749 [Ophiocordyceps australis]
MQNATSHASPLDILRPPPGVTPNYIDPPSKANTLRTIDAVFLTLMLIAVLIRIFVRLRFTRAWGWDDATCVLAATGSVAHTAMHMEGIKHGFGRHIWDIPLLWLASAENIRIFEANGINYPFTILFAKLSILLFYLRIFRINNILRIMIYITIFILSGFYLAMFALGIVAVAKCGLSLAADPICHSIQGPLIFINGGFNVATDFYILILPFPLLSALNLRLGQKLGVAAVFACGLAACAASLARLIGSALSYHTSDIFWNTATTSMFTTVEINIVIIVACVSTFPTFYTKTRVYLLSTTSSIRSRLFASPRGSVNSSEKA